MIVVGAVDTSGNRAVYSQGYPGDGILTVSAVGDGPCPKTLSAAEIAGGQRFDPDATEHVYGTSFGMHYIHESRGRYVVFLTHY